MSLVLNVEILGEFKKLTAATTGAQNSLSGLQKKVSGISRGIGRVVGALGITLGFAAIVNGFKDAVTAAEEARVANDRIEAIAKSMDEFGTQTAKVTKRIQDYADSQEMTVGVDAEVIKATQAKLLTFRNLTKTADTMGGSFDRATIAAIDMASAGFGSAESNATQLGKALNDPIKGITALNRAGITFTEDQKKLIESLVESGKVLEAQDIILTEIESQVGGTAEATVTASQRMNIAFGEIQEKVGTALLPVLDEFSQWLATPEGKAKLQEIVDGLVAIIEQGIKLVAWVNENKDWLVPMVLAIGGLTAAWNIATAAANTYKAAALLAAGAGVAGATAAGVGAGLAGIGAGAAVGGYMEGVTKGQTSKIYAGKGFQKGGPLFGDAFKAPKQEVTININKGNVTAKEIAKAVNKGTKTGGAPILTGSALRKALR
jgi:uncharacterized protein YoxC